MAAIDHKQVISHTPLQSVRRLLEWEDAFWTDKLLIVEEYFLKSFRPIVWVLIQEIDLIFLTLLCLFRSWNWSNFIWSAFYCSWVSASVHMLRSHTPTVPEVSRHLVNQSNSLWCHRFVFARMNSITSQRECLSSCPLLSKPWYFSDLDSGTIQCALEV